MSRWGLNFVYISSSTRVNLLSMECVRVAMKWKGVIYLSLLIQPCPLPRFEYTSMIGLCLSFAKVCYTLQWNCSPLRWTSLLVPSIRIWIMRPISLPSMITPSNIQSYTFVAVGSWCRSSKALPNCGMCHKTFLTSSHFSLKREETWTEEEQSEGKIGKRFRNSGHIMSFEIYISKYIYFYYF